MVAVLAEDFAEAELQPTLEQRADLLLWDWSRWVRDNTWLGYPRRCVTEKAGEGGITAGSPRPPTSMPDAVAATDRAVAALGLRHRSILRRVIYLRYERHLPLEGIVVALRCSKGKARATLYRAQRAVWHAWLLK